MKSKFSSFTVVFFVRDIDRTERFYRDILGIEIQRQPGGDEPDWLLASVGSGIELVFFAEEKTIGQSPVFVFGLEDGNIDGVVEQIAKAGVEIVTPVSEAPGGWSADFLDPDGHVLSYFQTDDLPRRKET